MPVDVAIFTVIAPRGLQRRLRCRISPYERISAKAIPVHWKICGSYVNSYLGRKEAERAGYDEAILLDRNGLITEASAANIFFLTRDGLNTPALTDDIFPGITRQTVLEWAKYSGVGVIERAIHSNDIKPYIGAFVCSTLMEISPVVSIDDIRYSTTDSDLYHHLLEWFCIQTRA